jgi:hypothetical protein
MHNSLAFVWEFFFFLGRFSGVASAFFFFLINLFFKKKKSYNLFLNELAVVASI